MHKSSNKLKVLRKFHVNQKHAHEKKGTKRKQEIKKFYVYLKNKEKQD